MNGRGRRFGTRGIGGGGRDGDPGKVTEVRMTRVSKGNRGVPVVVSRVFPLSVPNPKYYNFLILSLS